MFLRLSDEIEVKQNLSIIARERGKIITRREGHNIWLNLGREWTARLIAYSFIGLPADIPEEDNRVKYMGFGIGGTQQLAPGTANALPISPPYVGTNAQTDVDPTLTTIERPVRVSGSSTAYPGIAGDEWIGVIQAPAVHTVPTETTFSRVFTLTEISYSPFLSVPLSEIGLFIASADPENYQNTMIAYDTFDTLSKTTSFELEVQWTIKF
jgi:hypothetical protein